MTPSPDSCALPGGGSRLPRALGEAGPRPEVGAGRLLSYAAWGSWGSGRRGAGGERVSFLPGSGSAAAPRPAPGSRDGSAASAQRSGGSSRSRSAGSRAAQRRVPPRAGTVPGSPAVLPTGPGAPSPAPGAVAASAPSRDGGGGAVPASPRCSFLQCTAPAADRTCCGGSVPAPAPAPGCRLCPTSPEGPRLGAGAEPAQSRSPLALGPGSRPLRGATGSARPGSSGGGGGEGSRFAAPGRSTLPRPDPSRSVPSPRCSGCPRIPPQRVFNCLAFLTLRRHRQSRTLKAARPRCARRCGWPSGAWGAWPPAGGGMGCRQRGRGAISSLHLNAEPPPLVVRGGSELLPGADGGIWRRSPRGWKSRGSRRGAAGCTLHSGAARAAGRPAGEGRGVR